jgi:hypothetical protein
VTEKLAEEGVYGEGRGRLAWNLARYLGVVAGETLIVWTEEQRRVGAGGEIVKGPLAFVRRLFRVGLVDERM